MSENIHNVTRLVEKWASGPFERFRYFIKLRTLNNADGYHEADAREILRLLSMLNSPEKAPNLRRLTLHAMFKLFNEQKTFHRHSLYLPLLPRLEELDFYTFDSPDIVVGPLEHYLSKGHLHLKRISLYYYPYDTMDNWWARTLDGPPRLSAELRNRLIYITPATLYHDNPNPGLDELNPLFGQLLTSALQTFPALTHLRLQPNPLQDSLESILRQLSELKSLSTLRLDLTFTLQRYYEENHKQEKFCLTQLQLFYLNIWNVPVGHYELIFDKDFSAQFAQIFPNLNHIYCEMPWPCWCVNLCRENQWSEWHYHAPLRTFFKPIRRDYIKAYNENTSRRRKLLPPTIMLGHKKDGLIRRMMKNAESV